MDPRPGIVAASLVRTHRRRTPKVHLGLVGATATVSDADGIRLARFHHEQQGSAPRVTGPGGIRRGWRSSDPGDRWSARWSSKRKTTQALSPGVVKFRLLPTAAPHRAQRAPRSPPHPKPFRRTARKPHPATVAVKPWLTAAGEEIQLRHPSSHPPRRPRSSPLARILSAPRLRRQGQTEISRRAEVG